MGCKNVADGAGKATSKVAPTPLGVAALDRGNSFTLRRGKLSWEITYTKTGTFDPDAFGMLVWEMALLVCILIQAWTVPFLVCFEVIHPELREGSWLMQLSCVLEVPFAVDMYVQSRTGYYHMGNLVRHAKSSRKRYLRSRAFLMDVVAIVPLPWICWSSRGVYLINKLIRCQKLPTYMLAFDKVLARYFRFCKVVKAIVVIYFFCHYTASLYGAFGTSPDKGFWKLHGSADSTHHNVLTTYFAALFWTQGLVSKVVEGDIPRTLVQTLFTMVVMVGSFLLFVYICGTLFMISKCDTNSTERFNAKLNQLRHTLSYHQVPVSIQERAIEYLENEFKSGESNDRSTMKLLCPSISKDIKFTMLKTITSSVPFFKCCSAAVLRALIDLMETQSLPTNFIVTKAGDQEDGMYIVQSGVLVVLHNDTKIREIRKGGFVGELSLFSSQVRSTTVATATFCILHKLSRSHIRRVLRAYPQVESEIMQCVETLLAERDADGSDTKKPKGGKRQSNASMSWRALRQHMGSAKNHMLSQSLTSRTNSAHVAVAKNSPGSVRRTSTQFIEFKPTTSVSPDEGAVSPATSTDKDNVVVKSTLLRRIRQVQSWNWTHCLMESAIPRKSKFRLVWLVSVMVASLYNTITVPLVNAFHLIGYPTHVLVLNTVADAVLWADMYLNFNLSYVVEAEEIMDTTQCARRYWQSLFPLDLISAFPLWIFSPASHSLFRFLRLLRCSYLGPHLKEVEDFVTVDSRKRLVLLGIGLFVCYHIAGCTAHSMTFLLGYGTKPQGWLPPTTIELREVFNSTNGALLGYDYLNGSVFVPVNDPFVNTVIMKQYLRSIHYGAVCLTSLSMTLEPEALFEFALAVVVMLSGTLLISIVIDEVQKRVTASDIDQMEFLSLRSRIMHFLHTQKAPAEIHRRVESSMEFLWSIHRGANINDMMKDVPNSIRREIYGSICAPALDLMEHMDGIGTQLERLTGLFLDNVVIHLFGQGEILYRRGDYADALYLLLVGDIVLVANTRSSKAMPQRYVKQGEIFGCSSLHMGKDCSVHVDNAIARSACVVAVVDRKTIQDLNGIFPTFCANLLRKEQKLLAEHRAMTRLLEQSELAALSRQRAAGIIDPDSTFSIAWDTVLFFGTVFQVVRVPYLLAVGFSDTGITLRDMMAMVVETFFAIDIVLRTRTGYYSFGNKVTDKVKIRQRYFYSSAFVLDVLAVVPADLFNLYMTKRFEWLNVNKLLRVLQLSSRIQTLEQHYYTVSIQIRVFKLVFYTVLVAHFLGCAWYNFGSDAAGIMGYGGQNQFGRYLWLPDKNMDLANHDVSEMHKYLRIMFWGLGLSLGFYKGELPETIPEYIFTIVVQTTGVFLLAYLVGNLLDIVRVTEGNTRVFYSNLNFVRKLTAYFDFTEDVQSKIQHFYFYRLFHTIHEEHVLNACLPQSLVADIRLFLLTPMLKKVPFFQNETATSNVTRSLVRQLTQVLVTRHEVVCRQNEVGVEMYFVFTGCLEVFVASPETNRNHGIETNRRGTKVNEIVAGSFFGEKSLFSDQPRNASIEAKTFCTLYRLSRDHLESVFAQHPEWKSKVMQIVTKIYEAQAKAYRERKVTEAAGRKSDGLRHQGSNKGNRDTGGGSIHNLSSAFEDDPVAVVVPWRVSWKRNITSIEIQSRRYRVFLMVLGGSLFYLSLSVPYFVMFGQAPDKSSISTAISVLNVVSDIVFACDIWFKSHIVETTASREFYEHKYQYDGTGLALDIVAVLPIDYAFSVFTANANVLRINRFIKLRQLTHVIGELQRFSMSCEVNRLKTLAMYYCVLNYWTACMYFGLTYVVGFSTQWNNSLPHEYFSSLNRTDVEYSIHQFVRSLIYASSVYTGSGRVYEPTASLHLVFHCIVGVFGVFVIGYLIGEGSTLCIYIIQNEVDFQINQMNVMDFLTRKRVDIRLRSRIQKYMTFWWTFQNGVPYQTILEKLPRRIRAQANIDIARTSLTRFALRYVRPLVHHTPMGVDPVIHSIAHRLVYEGYPTGESVIVQGNIGHTMYFVSTGALMTVSTAPKFVSVRFDESHFFGDDGLFDNTARQYSVVTLRACDLLALSATDFLDALHEHPRLSECCKVARDIALRLSREGQGRHFGSMNLGRLVCDELVRNAADLKYLKLMEFDAAETMFGNFIHLFLRYGPAGVSDADNATVDVCQHCEERAADQYCKLCHQVLCPACSSSIHDNSYFSFHKRTLTRLDNPVLGPPAPSLHGKNPSNKLVRRVSFTARTTLYSRLFGIVQQVMQRQRRPEELSARVIHVSNEMISGSFDGSSSSRNHDLPKRHAKHIRHRRHPTLRRAKSMREAFRVVLKGGKRNNGVSAMPDRKFHSQGGSDRESKPLDVSATRRRASVDTMQHLSQLLNAPQTPARQPRAAHIEQCAARSAPLGTATLPPASAQEGNVQSKDVADDKAQTPNQLMKSGSTKGPAILLVNAAVEGT